MENARRLFSLRSVKLFRVTITTRSIMTTPELQAKVEKAAQELKTNPFYGKYAPKIATLQQTSPEEFLSRIEARHITKENKLAENPENARKYSSLLEPKKRLTSDVEIQDASLDKIMKTDLLKSKTSSEIARIWTEYHLNKDFITASIPDTTYDRIVNKSKAYPMFLFPIPRSQGYEFIICQFCKNAVHFTTLLSYQVHKENAPECLTITHYTEFKDSRNIVLMRGEFDKNVLNVQEAQCLANQLQMYYGQDDDGKDELLERFTNKPSEFKHMDVIKQIETMSIN